MEHVILFYGTAQINYDNFVPSQDYYSDKSGNRIENDRKWFNIDGLRFGRMTTTYTRDKIDYKKTNEKPSDVPILVSVENIKFEKPLQLDWRHFGQTKNTHYEGNPGPKKISTASAKGLLKEVIEINPNQRKELIELFENYFEKY